MKKLSILSILLCAFAGLTLTSCFDDDDDDNSLTPDQKQQCYVLTRGTHYGNLISPKDASSTDVTKNDTVQTSWSITTDSTMVLNNIPSKAIAVGITNKDLKTAIENQPSRDIKCYIGYIKTDPIQWLINPETITYDNLSYGGQNHKVQIAFYANNLYSFGVFNSTSGAMNMQIIVAGVFIDGRLDSTLMPNAVPLGFSSLALSK